MKIILQGYLGDANFGDMLSACLFYERCQKAGFQSIDFYQYKNYGIGDFCRQQIGYRTVKKFFSCFFADAFVIISGGCLWNNGNWSWDADIRYKRFILPALIFQFLRKPVYVLGVGGGPVDTLWLRKKMVKMLNKAKVITFRDEQTKNIFTNYGVKNKMIVTADTALCIQENMLKTFDEKKKLNEAAKGRKKILLHIPDGEKENLQINEIVVPAILKFIKYHKDYYLVLSNDNIRHINDIERIQIKNLHSSFEVAGIDFYDYKYHDCWQMCSLINEMDSVITSKLHVGVVACSLKKSVIAFPVHREKTDNFYQMIGESDRCINMRDLTTEKAYIQIIKYHDKKVQISDELRLKATKNLAILDNIASKN